MECKDHEIPRLWLDVIAGESARRQFEGLLNRAFEVPASRSFLEDFPIWDEAIVPSDEKIVRLGVFAPSAHFSGAGQLVACTGVRIARLATPSGSVPVALIGAVATDEGHRGEGLASQLVSIAVEWARSRGASAAFLWGSEHSLYQRLGFELCGAQVMIPLHQVSFSEASATEVRSGWDPAIFRAMRKRSGGLLLEDQDEKWLSSHSRVQWYWMGDRQNCDAYVAIGRGIDLDGIAHEWGGDPTKLRALLAWLKARQPHAILLGSPELLSAAGIDSSSAQPEFLCLAQLFDPERIARGFATSSDLMAAGDGDGFSGATPRQVFGPCPGRLVPPAPLWIWGLDAV